MRLQQTLLNLLSNVLKFTAQGKVQLIARCLDAGTDSSRVKVSVSDTEMTHTPGISADDLASEASNRERSQALSGRIPLTRRMTLIISSWPQPFFADKAW